MEREHFPRKSPSSDVSVGEESCLICHSKTHIRNNSTFILIRCFSDLDADSSSAIKSLCGWKVHVAARGKSLRTTNWKGLTGLRCIGDFSKDVAMNAVRKWGPLEKRIFPFRITRSVFLLLLLFCSWNKTFILKRSTFRQVTKIQSAWSQKPQWNPIKLTNCVCDDQTKNATWLKSCDFYSRGWTTARGERFLETSSGAVRMCLCILLLSRLS